MKSLMTFFIFSTFLFSGSFGLQCYSGIYPNITTYTCSPNRSNFCAIVHYKSGSLDQCEEETCTELDCTNDYFCEEPGIFYENDLYGLKFEINCCEKYLCNLLII